MTGYGRSKKSDASSPEAGENAGEAWVRSVNGRFLEIRVHLPREWAELEPDLRALAQTALSRGTVDLHVNRVRGNESKASVEIDEKLAKQWMVALRRLAKATGAKSSAVPFDLIAKAPDVIRVVNEAAITANEKARVL